MSLIKNLIELLRKRTEIQKKLYSIDNEVNETVLRIKKMEKFK